MTESAPVPDTELPPSGAIQAGDTFDEPAIDLGGPDGEPGSGTAARVRIPLSMLNRHGLVAGATGTGKTKTLQVLAEATPSPGCRCSPPHQG